MADNPESKRGNEFWKAFFWLILAGILVGTSTKSFLMGVGVFLGFAILLTAIDFAAERVIAELKR